MKRVLFIAGLALTSTIGSTQTGCATPTAPVSSMVTTTSAGIVFHATAQKTTASTAGIAKWHSIIEHGSGAVVVDGVDADGKLKFSTSFRSLSNGHYQIQDHIHKTELTFDKHGTVLTSTLSASWQKTAALYSQDWSAFQQTVPYGTWGYVSNGLWVVAGAAAVVAGVAALPAAVGVAAVVAAGATIVGGVVGMAAGVTGAVDLYQSDKASAQAADQNTAQQKQMQDQIDSLKTQIQQNNPSSSTSSTSSSSSSSSSSGSTDTDSDGTSSSSSSSSSGDDGTTSADNSSTTDSSNTQTADNASTTDQQGTDLPAADDSASSNLDTANLDSSTDNSQVADNAGSTGDDDTTTASLGFASGDLVAYSTGKCLKSLKSKTTGITVCAHY